MKRLILLFLLITCHVNADTYSIRRGGRGPNIPSEEGFILVGVGGASWALAESDCVVDLNANPPTVTCAGAGAFYNTVQDEGTPLTQRAKINFIGSLVTCADDAGNTRTNCTFTNPPAYATVEEEGTPLTQRSTINFVGSTITCADSGGKTVCTLTSGSTNALLDGSNHTDTTNSGVTKGDLIIGNSTPAWDDLPGGSEGEILMMVDGLPTWVNEDQIVDISDEMCCREINSTTYSCNLGWQTHIQNSADATVVSANNLSANHPCVVLPITSTASNGRIGMSVQGAGVGNTGPWNFGGGEIIATWIIRTSTLSTVSDRYTIRVGFMDLLDSQTSTTGPDHGCFFEYSDDINGGEWECQCNDSGAGTPVDSNAAPSANTFYNLKMVVAADASEVDFYIDGSLVCNYNTAGNIPDGTADIMAPSIFIGKSAGGNSRGVYLDYLRVRQILTTPR